MPAQYDRNGLKFMYPENWVLSDQGDTDLPRAVSLETPEGGMWSAHFYDAQTDPDFLIKDTVTTLEETYPDLEVTPSEHVFPEFSGTAVDTIFFCLDFLVRIKLMTLQTSDYQIMVWYQAEDRDFEKQSLIFHAVTTSMMQSISGVDAARQADD